MPVFKLTDSLVFPPPELARSDGLLAVGGDLSPERLLLAYQLGIFPWYAAGEPILWWAPDPRCVLFPDEFHSSRRLTRTLRRKVFTVTFDQAFERVITECARIRLEQGEETWIDDAMIDAYCRLHGLGYAHSVECWRGDTLAGGLYGVCLGAMFFGESMFSRVRDASKVALAHLVQFGKRHNWLAIDCQVPSDHLHRLGARDIPAALFRRLLATALTAPYQPGPWR